MEMYAQQSEAFYFTFDGQLYCDSFSLKTGTKQYGECHAKISTRLSTIQEDLKEVSHLLELYNRGAEPIEIIEVIEQLPRRTFEEDWDEYIEPFDDYWDECIDHTKRKEIEREFHSKKLNKIIEKHGAWTNYISSMQVELQSLLAEEQQLNNTLIAYEGRVNELMSDIVAKPYALLD